MTADTGGNITAAINYIAARYCGQPYQFQGTRTMSAFDGQLAVGTVTGVRSWRLASDGNLAGVYGASWGSRTMTAKCGLTEQRCRKEDVPGESCQCGIYAYWSLRCTDCCLRLQALASPPPTPDRDWDMSQLQSFGDFIAGAPLPPYRAAVRETPEPDAAALQLLKTRAVSYDPSCGTRCSGGWIHGVVEGYGNTLIGTRGFRCQKARMVALCLPPWPMTSREVANGLLETAAQLRDVYRVPVYTSITDLLTRHPRTTDYREEN